MRSTGTDIKQQDDYLLRFKPSKITEPLIRSTNSGLDLDLHINQQHYLAGGNSDKVIDIMMAAKEHNISLNYKITTAFDFSGADVRDFVNHLTSQNELYNETELRQVTRAYLESLDQDMLAINRMA